jgi:tetratricopeptide (TPR) repeat protein/O-antigen ligase
MSKTEKSLVKILKIGLHIALFTIIPVLQKFMFPFITMKVFSFQVLIEILLPIWLFLILFYPKYRPRINLLTTAILVFLGSLFVSGLFGFDFERSFWATMERQIGIFTLLHFGAFFLMFSVFEKSDWRKYLNTSFVLSLIVSVFGIFQIFNPDIILKNSPDVGGRAGSFLGNPTFLAAYVLFNIFIGLWLFAENISGHGKSRNLGKAIFYGAGVIFQSLIIIIATQTRGAMIGLFAGILILLLYFAFKKYKLEQESNLKILKKISISALIILVVFSGIFLFTREASVWQKIPGLNRITTISLNDATTQTRLISWGVALESFKEKLVLGWGWENFKYAFDKNYPPEIFRAGFSETYWDKPHNVFLEYLVTGGVLGLASYLFLFICAFYLLSRQTEDSLNRLSKPFIFAGLIGYLVQNTFVFDTFASYLMLFIFLAFINSFSNPDVSGENPARDYSKFKKSAVILASLSSLFLIFLNSNILYANNRHFWIANYFVNEEPEKAIASYEKVPVRFNPYINDTRKDFTDVSAQIYKQGLLPEPTKNLQKALYAIDQAIGSNPKNYFYYTVLADVITNFYDLNPETLSKIANAAIQKAIELSPNRQQNYYVLSKLRILEGDKVGAVEVIQKAVNLDPESPDPYFFLGLLLLETGNSAEGFPNIEKAMSMGRNPRTAKEYRVLANYYGDAEEYDKSIEYYKKAIELDKEDAESVLKLGIVYYYVDDRESAKETFEQFIKIAPEFKNNKNYPQIKPFFDDLGIKF